MRPQIKYGRFGERHFFLEGQEVSQEEFDAVVPDLGIHLPGLANNTPSCWPQVSQAFGVHPKQIASATARNKRHGVNVKYDNTGRAHIPDRGARRELSRLEGMTDNEAGYGD